MLNMIEPEFPRDDRSYGHNLHSPQIYISKTPELTIEAERIEKDKNLERSFLRKFLLAATQTLSSSSIESKDKIFKKRA